MKYVEEDEYEYRTKIDVEESKRLGRIVTKEIGKTDPDYDKYPSENKYLEAEKYGYFEEGYNDSIVSIVSPILLLVLAPGFVILNAKHKMDLFGTILLLIIFVFICSINFIIIFGRYEEKDYYSKELSKKIALKTATLIIWTIIFSLIPVLTNADLASDTAASNRYILLYGIYIVLFGIDNFISIIFIREKQIHKRISSTIDRLQVISTTIILWGYGAVISFLLFDEAKWIILFNGIIFITFVGLSLINYFISKRKAKDMSYNPKVISRLLDESRIILIVFFISFIFILLIWIICFFKLLK